MYVTYSYYAGTYGGTLLTEDDFTVAAREAETYIRHLTFASGNIFEDGRDTDTVWRAVCAAAEACHLAVKECMEGGNIRSESKDGLSMSFIVARKDGETLADYAGRCMYGAVRPLLLPTGWLSRKVRKAGCGHDHECGCSDCL